VRRLIQWTLVPVAIAAIACKGDKPVKSSMTDDLKRDLQLASTVQNIRISPDEIAPKSQPELTVRPKKAPNGPKVIRTEKPTVKASATPVEVAEIKTDLPEVQAIASNPSPSESPSDAPPLARPAPVPMPTYPSAAAIPAANDGGSGGIMAGVFGAVIRGGRVGDDDHCDPRGMPARRPQGGRVIGSGEYVPPIVIGMGGMGGMGAGRTQPMVGRRR
jgi:hypothetical protein